MRMGCGADTFALENFEMRFLQMKRIGILTGGGDVPPLNALIYSALQEANKNEIELYGFLRGWDGLLNENYILLSNMDINYKIGGTILKSSRVNLAINNHYPDKVKNTINKLHLDGLIIIGGEDTLSNSIYVNNIPSILVSKTIDNDFGSIDINGNNLNILNLFTLGHPTAARKLASFVSYTEGLRTTAYSHERIIIIESMGMHAGWLALSSAMGFPDFIIIPEIPVDYDHLKDQIIKHYEKNKNCIVVVAEGAKWKNGTYISADNSEKDDFNHPRFIDSAAKLAEKLKKDLGTYCNTRNINFINPSYLYRSGKPCDLDLQMALKIGAKAIQLFLEGLNSSIFISIQYENEFSIKEHKLSDFTSIKKFHRFVPEQFYDKLNYQATQLAYDYIKLYSSPLEKVDTPNI